MANNVITIREETAQDFLPAEMHRRGAIDLHELSKLAKKAMQGSELSLAAATEIADGNLISRLWNSGEMQKHIIQSISYLGDISKVNLALSAICNDLAAENLEHARRINANHHATNTGLNKVKTQTGELLEHLRKPSLLDGLLPALGAANLADHDAMRGWLRSLSEAINLQYSSLQANVQLLTKQQAPFTEWVDRVSAEVSSLDARLRTSLTESTQRADKTDATIRKSHEVLAAALTTLNQQLARHQSEFQTAIQSEHASRDAMQLSILSLIKQREGAIRVTIGELNQHLLKRMLWGASGIVVLQILGFGFLAFKMGLFK